MEFTKSEAKEWARKYYHGMDGVIQPSYTPDLERLDEEGIRHDVRHNISKGMFSVFCAIEVSALSSEERKQFLKIVAEEAKDKVLVSMFGALDDAERSIELLNYFESVGGTHTLLGWPGNFYAKSEEDIFQVTKKICDSINLAVDLWPKPFYDLSLGTLPMPLCGPSRKRPLSLMETLRRGFTLLSALGVFFHRDLMRGFFAVFFRRTVLRALRAIVLSLYCVICPSRRAGRPGRLCLRSGSTGR